LNYYNEIDPYCCAWLSNLMDAGLITPGKIDDRTIHEVTPDDVQGFTRCHFFAGLGGWDYAFNLAGWGDRSVWSGSVPCQPFSTAGERRAFDDSRDLWPVWHRLIRDARPVALFGEQVDDAVGFGWFDRVRTDLESNGYSVAPPLVIPACSVGAPHRRDRLWFVAESDEQQRHRRGDTGPRWRTESPDGGDLGDAGGAGLAPSQQQTLFGTRRRDEGRAVEQPGRAPWGNSSLVVGADGKARRVESGIRLLAHGVPARIPKLRALGNAIVPQLAAEIIGAYLDSED
jgi:DNA (cytosine-5)-methyltransferase 1